MILGVAMLVAPEASVPSEDAQVSRADTSAMALASTAPVVEPVALIDETEVMPKPEEITVAATEPAVTPEPAQSERVEVTLAAPQIGGIAALAGLEPAPTNSAVLAGPAPAPQASASLRTQFHYVTGSRVNVRSGPSTDFRVIGRALYGDSVEVLSQDDAGWAEIRLIGTDDIGFMSADFLAADLNG